MVDINQAVMRLLAYWKQQGLGNKGESNTEIEKIERKLNIKLPHDFKVYFSIINGMGESHLNDTDHSGFSFYPIEDITLFHEDCKMFKSGFFSSNRKCIVFADYLQKCWSYGALIDMNNTSDNYRIFMYVDIDNSRIIANSLADFIDLYLSDSEILY